MHTAVKISWNYLQSFSSYCPVNTLYLSYKNQVVIAVQEIAPVLSEIHLKHVNGLCGQNVEFSYVKPFGT